MSSWNDWNSKEEIFKKGDLVKFYEYENFHYGDGVLRATGVGVVLGCEIVSWCPEAQEWIDVAVRDPYVVRQYRVFCVTGVAPGVKRLFGARSLEILSHSSIEQK
jgi:hypothetical protein